MAANKNKTAAIEPEMADETRRREPGVDDAPSSVPATDEDLNVRGRVDTEDGGIEQHPVHDDDVEDMDSEKFEELADEAAVRGIRSE